MRDRLHSGILWLMAATVGAVTAIMVVSSGSADAGQPTPEMQMPCRSDQFVVLAGRYDNQIFGWEMEALAPADQATRWAEQSAANVSWALGDRQVSFIYSVPDRGRDAVAIFSSGPDDSLDSRRVMSVLECVS